MTSSPLADFTLSPNLVVGAREHRQLTVLALAGTTHTAEDSDWLLHELERASVVPDATVPEDVVRINSSVVYRPLGGEERVVKLVLPKDADGAAHKVSVLSPVGSALLGLRAGHSITWLTADGRKQVLTVLSVRQPPGPAPDGGRAPPDGTGARAARFLFQDIAAKRGVSAMTDITITKAEGAGGGRYVARIEGIDSEGEIAFSRKAPDLVSADHTTVPEALGGRGVAKALLDFMLEDARASGFRIIPTCPFVSKQAARHPEWAGAFATAAEAAASQRRSAQDSGPGQRR
jgi:transcription elongation GreA/GreB family factor/predicted GNAT family acetyltransferase